MRLAILVGALIIADAIMNSNGMVIHLGENVGPGVICLLVFCAIEDWCEFFGGKK